MVINQLYRIDWKLFSADWTEKAFKGVKSDADADIVAMMKDSRKKPSLNENEYEYEESDDDNKVFDDAAPLHECAHLKLSFQLIANEGNFVLNHSLVPKGEQLKHFVPPMAKVIEKNFLLCDKHKSNMQIRTDGIDVNSNVSDKSFELLEEKYYDSDTEKSILVSENGKYFYDLSHFKENHACVCIIYVLFIHYLYIIYI